MKDMAAKETMLPYTRIFPMAIYCVQLIGQGYCTLGWQAIAFPCNLILIEYNRELNRFKGGLLSVVIILKLTK